MHFSDTCSPSTRLALAVKTQGPSLLARHFAAFAGQFYDRSALDAFARQAHDLYALDDPGQAESFRRQLDRRLYDRYHQPVAWVLSPTRGEPSS